MTSDERLELARKLMRASLALPQQDAAQAAIQAAVEALMAKPVVSTTPQTRAARA